VEREDFDVGEYGTTCHARLSRLLMDWSNSCLRALPKARFRRRGVSVLVVCPLVHLLLAVPVKRFPTPFYRAMIRRGRYFFVMASCLSVRPSDSVRLSICL